MNATEATKRPWKISPITPGDKWINIYAPGVDAFVGVNVTVDRDDVDHDVAEANAALIVEAVNAYDTLRAENARLREACERTVRDLRILIGKSTITGEPIYALDGCAAVVSIVPGVISQAEAALAGEVTDAG